MKISYFNILKKNQGSTMINRKLKNFIIKKKKIKNFNLFLSISDEKDYSVAFTILQTK